VSEPLVPSCVLPGCVNLVAAWGDACSECRAVFGPMLRETSGPPLTADEIAARDSDVRHAYRYRRLVKEGR